MYWINKTEVITENGAKATAYGIECEKYAFNSLTTDKDKIELLCKLCNRLDLNEEQLIYVVEDFIGH